MKQYGDLQIELKPKYTVGMRNRLRVVWVEKKEKVDACMDLAAEFIQNITKNGNPVEFSEVDNLDVAEGRELWLDILRMMELDPSMQSLMASWFGISDELLHPDAKKKEVGYSSGNTTASATH